MSATKERGRANKTLDVRPEEALQLACALGGLRHERRVPDMRGIPLFDDDEGPVRRKAWIWYEARREWSG